MSGPEMQGKALLWSKGRAHNSEFPIPPATDRAAWMGIWRTWGFYGDMRLLGHILNGLWAIDSRHLMPMDACLRKHHPSQLQ